MRYVRSSEVALEAAMDVEEVTIYIRVGEMNQQFGEDVAIFSGG